MIIKIEAANRLAAANIKNPRDKLLPPGWTIERWYDRQTRSWVAQLLDPNDNQVGEAVYVYKASEIKAITVDDWSDELKKRGIHI